MRRLMISIARHLPARRRRSWQYVSPRRRELGLAALALLLLGVMGYWHLTNDRHVHEQATRYLRQLTGGRVEITKARFGLLAGLELSDVRVYVPGSPSPSPLFRAGTLVLRHDPWSLLGGKPRVTEVNCLGAQVTLEHDIQRNVYSFEQLLEARRRRRDQPRLENLENLPPIRMRDARLVWVDVDGKLRLPHEAAQVSLTLQPQGDESYLATFEQRLAGQGETISFQTLLNVSTGQATRVSGSASLGSLDPALPGKYRQWRQRYDVSGEVRWRSAGSPGQDQRLEMELADVSLRLPDEEGALDLVHVSGEVWLDEHGLSLQKVSGQVSQLGDARFELTGRYDGFDAVSPFELAMKVWSLQVPDQPVAKGPLEDVLARFRRYFSPRGQMDADLLLRRRPGESPSAVGVVCLRDMTIRPKWFPYTMERVNGTIRLEKGQAVLEGLTAEHGSARAVIAGQVQGINNYDVVVESTDVPVEQALYDALPRPGQSAWRQMNPQGVIGTLVRLRRAGSVKPIDVDVELRCDGRASVCYVGFPYRLGQLIGTTTIDDGRVTINRVSGGAGQANCIVDGKLVVSDEGVAADLDIEARRLGVDAELVEAIAHASARRDWIIEPVGLVERASAKVRCEAGAPLDFHVQTAVNGVAGAMAFAPYPFEQGVGELTVEPGRLIFRDFRARRGPTSLAVNGQLLLGDVMGMDLNLQARGLVFDEALRAAMPPPLRRGWDNFSPSGRADVDLSLRHGPGVERQDYRLEIRPLDMQARHRKIPLSLENLTGKVILTPRRVELADIRSRSGPSSLQLDGHVDLGTDRTSGRLSGRLMDLPISAALLEGFPRDLAWLGSRLHEGGSLDVELASLEFGLSRGPGGPSAPTSQIAAGQEPSTAPASGPWGNSWRCQGTLRLDEVMVDLDFGQRALSGTVGGVASRDATGVSLQLDVDLDRIDLGGHQITHLSGQCTKASGSGTIIMDNFTANVGTGRAAGWARIDLGQPREYGLHISAEDVPLGELLGSTTQPAEPVAGLLEGNLELTGQIGQVESRRASGVLRFDQARMYELPVVLGLFHVIPVPLPARTHLSEGEADYRLEGNRLTLDQVYLGGPASSMLGSGTMDLRKQTLNLVFLTGPAGRLGPLARLAMPLGGLSGEIMRFRVHGRLDRPQIQPEAFRSLDEAMQVLLNPAE